jgi:hypothetical protein
MAAHNGLLFQATKAKQARPQKGTPKQGPTLGPDGQPMTRRFVIRTKRRTEIKISSSSMLLDCTHNNCRHLFLLHHVTKYVNPKKHITYSRIQTYEAMVALNWVAVCCEQQGFKHC